jgi:Lectin C-type domain
MHAGEFWTSATDKNSTGRFRWCSSGAMVIKDVVRWKPAHPTTGCVYLDNTVKMDNVTVLATADCTQEKYFICEASLKCVCICIFYLFCFMIYTMH